MAFSLGFVFALPFLLAALSEPLFGIRAPNGPFVPVWVAGCFLVIIWIVGTSRAWNKRWGVHCPQCHKLVSDGDTSAPWAAYCRHCGEKIVEDVEYEPSSSWLDGVTKEPASEEEYAIRLDELRRKLREDFGVVWRDD